MAYGSRLQLRHLLLPGLIETAGKRGYDIMDYEIDRGIDIYQIAEEREKGSGPKAAKEYMDQLASAPRDVLPAIEFYVAGLEKRIELDRDRDPARAPLRGTNFALMIVEMAILRDVVKTIQRIRSELSKA